MEEQVGSATSRWPQRVVRPVQASVPAHLHACLTKHGGPRGWDHPGLPASVGEFMSPVIPPGAGDSYLPTITQTAARTSPPMPALLSAMPYAQWVSGTPGRCRPANPATPRARSCALDGVGGSQHGWDGTYLWAVRLLGLRTQQCASLARGCGGRVGGSCGTR